MVGGAREEVNDYTDGVEEEEEEERRRVRCSVEGKCGRGAAEGEAA